MLDSILGGLGKVGDWIANRENARHNNNMTKDLAQQNMAMQREFAQSGIQWRVADAKAAGVHPIYALGSAGASFSPVSANFSAPASSELGGAGQDIGRAIHATSTDKQRGDAFTVASQKLQLERGALENEVLRAELASKTGRMRATPNPPFPAAADPWLIPGQSGSGPLTTSKPLEITPASPNRPHMEGGAITDVGAARTADGWAPIPSKDVKERIEDNMPQEWMHFFRNNILPSLGVNMSPPPFKAPAGKSWWFNTLRQEYQLVPDGERPLAGHKYEEKK